MDPLSSNPSPAVPPSRATETRETSISSKDTSHQSTQLDPIESVALSQTGKEINQYMETLANLPDVRQERISKIQNALEQGTYSVSTEALAEKLIQDISNQPPEASSSDSR